MPLFSTLKGLVDRHYEAKAKANCNTCHVGTWVIFREDHLAQKTGGFTMKAFFQRLSCKGKKQSTIPPECPPLVTESCQCASKGQGCKILIVCKGNSFSRNMADYAINMAKKTRSSLVALNLVESGSNFEDFSTQAKNNIEYFSCKAADAGLGFNHEIRQGDQEKVVAQMHADDPQFKYVMDDSAVVCKSRGSIPVYTRATLHAK